MSNDTQKGIITLVLRNDRDRTDLKIWQPISLLNYVTKVLANRIIGILPKFIDSDQSEYMKIRDYIRPY